MWFAHGQVQWEDTQTIGTDIAVTGLPGTPKAIRIIMSGFNAKTLADTLSSDVQVISVGFATASAQRCFSASDDDGAGTSDCGIGARNDCVAMVCAPGGGSSAGRLSRQSFDANGFTLNVDEVTAPDNRVQWEAWGGDDVSAEIVTVDEPAANGDANYTGSIGQPDLLLYAGNNSTSALNSAPQAADASVTIGAADSSGNQWTLTCHSDHASGTSDTGRYHKTGQFIANIISGGGNPDATATFVQMNSDGFRLNWTRAVTGRRGAVLMLKGFQARVGSFTINSSGASNTATVSGLPFQPEGVLVATGWGSEQAAGTAADESYFSVGRFTSTTDRSSAGWWSDHGIGTTDVYMSVQGDQILTLPLSTTTQDALDASAMNSDGFTAIVDDASSIGGTTMLVSYVAFADAAAVTVTPPPGKTVLQAVSRSVH